MPGAPPLVPNGKNHTMPEITLRSAPRRTGRSAAASLALALGAGTLAATGAVSTADSAQAAETTYTVRPGDGWYAISRNTGVPVSTLLSLNGMTLDTMLHPEMVLKTGGTPAAAPAPAPKSGTYTVMAGDGWWVISYRTGVSASTLQSINNMTPQTVLHPGMVLKTTTAGAASSPAPAPSTTAPSKQAAVDYVIDKVQDPDAYYTWGGNGPYGFDCSGLMQQAYAQAGISIPRTGGNQFAAAKAYVPISQAQPGDLVFYANQSTGRIYHTAMYMGGGQLAHALNEDAGLVFTSTTIMKSDMLAVVARY